MFRVRISAAEADRFVDPHDLPQCAVPILPRPGRPEIVPAGQAAAETDQSFPLDGTHRSQQQLCNRFPRSSGSGQFGGTIEINIRRQFPRRLLGGSLLESIGDPAFDSAASLVGCNADIDHVGNQRADHGNNDPEKEGQRRPENIGDRFGGFFHPLRQLPRFVIRFGDFRVRAFILQLAKLRRRKNILDLVAHLIGVLESRRGLLLGGQRARQGDKQTHQ